MGERVPLLLSAEFGLTPDDLGGERGVKTYHHYIEVAKFANGQKRSIRDPQFNNPKVRSLSQSKQVFKALAGNLRVPYFGEFTS